MVVLLALFSGGGACSSSSVRPDDDAAVDAAIAVGDSRAPDAVPVDAGPPDVRRDAIIVGTDAGADSGVRDAARDATPFDAGSDAAIVVVPGCALPVRQIRPLSGTTVGTTTPEMTVEVAADVGAIELELCTDRTCSTSTRQSYFGAEGLLKLTPIDVAARRDWFWRVRPLGDTNPCHTSPIWSFRTVDAGVAMERRDHGRRLMFDFDGDGRADVPELSPLRIRHGAPLSRITALGDDASFAVPVGDVDGDGRGDLLVDRVGTEDELRLVLEGGVRTISLAGSIRGFFSSVAALGDVNGDGYADFALNGGDGSIAYVGVYFGGASPGDAPIHRITDFGSGGHLAGGDFNGDGFGDLVISSYPGGVRIYWGEWMHPLVLTRDLDDVPTSSFSGEQVTAADLSGDFRDDLLVMTGETDVVFVAFTDIASDALMRPTRVAIPATTFFVNDVYDWSRGGVQFSATSPVESVVVVGNSLSIGTTENAPGVVVVTGASAAFRAGVMSERVTAGDIDGDGVDDVVTGDGLFRGNPITVAPVPVDP